MALMTRSLRTTKGQSDENKYTPTARREGHCLNNMDVSLPPSICTVDKKQKIEANSTFGLAADFYGAETKREDMPPVFSE